VREFLLKHCYQGWHHVAGPNGVREVPYYATRLTDEQKRELLLGSAEGLTVDPAALGPLTAPPVGGKLHVPGVGADGTAPRRGLTVTRRKP
jgi:hypothetical protein